MLWGVFLHFLSVFIPFVCVSFLFYLLLSHFKSGAWRKEADKWQHLLVVTAHPDDECMFFSPSIFDFIRRQKHVSVLCFSDDAMNYKTPYKYRGEFLLKRLHTAVAEKYSGNYMELADTRKKELYDSCRILGIQENNVQIVGDSCFPDDPSRIWNEELVARIILKHLLIIKPDVVLTFDQYGISGHNNHCSIYYGCRKLLQDGRAPTGINFYSLETTNILRKYVSFLDIPLSTVLTSKCYISTISAAIRAVRAMCAHSSQITWYRIAYLMFSRYMLINTLVDVLPGINMPR